MGLYLSFPGLSQSSCTFEQPFWHSNLVFKPPKIAQQRSLRIVDIIIIDFIGQG